MGEYQLSRARSAAIVRSNSLASRPSHLISRTSSVPDLTSYTIASTRTSWPSYYTYTSRYWPYRYYRDYSLYDDYWYDRYRYFSPLYYRSLFPRRYSYSDNLPNPYLWNDDTYWVRYKSYLYDYLPRLGRFNYPYSNSYYSPYRYYLHNSLY